VPANSPSPPRLAIVADPATAGLLHEETEVGSVFVSNYPPFSAWTAEDARRYADVLAQPPRPGAPLGLYMHIPFCRKRCKFCYFRVYTDKNADEIGRYTRALAREVRQLAEQSVVADRPLSFVYFGGGTPSYISVRHLKELVASVREVLPWDGAEEITFECEPGTLTQSKLEAIREVGVTRLSLGIENFDDAVLRENGRAHVSAEIERCLPWIEELGFDQLNIDLIAGMVGERWESWRETVARTVALAPDSVTIYQLELPHNTVYSSHLKAGELPQPLATWAEKRAWQQYAWDELAKAGYLRSSAYTMCRPKPDGRMPRFVYRDSVWHGCDLLGTGVSSFGHVSGLHVQNSPSWGDYLEAVEAGRLPITRAYATSAEDRFRRELILQTKLGRIDPAAFRQKFGEDPRERFASQYQDLVERGYAVLHPDRIEITAAGLLRVDALLPAFYAEEYRGARYT
jgi:oxygen-independent coproporphyrinogen-3 oxidase